MTAHQLAQVLQTVTVAILAILVFFYVIATVRLDSLRQQLFALRDEMFDYALEGKVAFSDPAYVQLRDLMNKLIRYGHHLTMARSISSLLIRWAEGVPKRSTWDTVWEASVSRIPSEAVQHELKSFHDRAMRITIKHIVFGSPLLILAIILGTMLLAISNLARGTFTGLRQAAKAATGRVMTGPLDPRVIEQDAMCATY